jgi:Dolichyl-phosphate-mannose-protein mannosyltransferase
MTERRSRYAKSIVLFLVAAIPRVLGAFFLPNAFGDAYVYIQEIGTLSTKIGAGSFRLTDLFGFWLPLYQMIAALLNVFVRNGFYSGKIVAAFFGAGTCLFVYLVTKRLTQNEGAALCMFLVIAFNPLHVFYSASAMTDVPHAFFVLGALYFVLTRNWIVAATFAALAGFTRVESWMFIAVLPCIQFIKERRISIPALIILILPPLLWFYISWKATGNWLECFVQRQQYHDWLLQMNPAIARFSFSNVLRDGVTLLVSSDIAVLIAVFVAGWLLIKETPRWLTRTQADDGMTNVVGPVFIFFGFLGLLVIAYLTHQQPIIFPRYGLILFTLGLPILGWTFGRIKQTSAQPARRILIGIVAILSIDTSIQLAGAVGTVNQYRTQRAVADYLRDHIDPSSESRIFCDEGTVRVLSGIPESRFITSSAMVIGVNVRSNANPAEFGQDKVDPHSDTFIRLLRANRVEYVAISNVQGSVLADSTRQGAGPDLAGFEPVFHSQTNFLPTNIWLMKTSNPNPR